MCLGSRLDVDRRDRSFAATGIRTPSNPQPSNYTDYTVPALSLVYMFIHIHRLIFLSFFPSFFILSYIYLAFPSHFFPFFLLFICSVNCYIYIALVIDGISM